MEKAVTPAARPGLSVALRAIVAGGLLGVLTGAALVVGDPTNVADATVLPGIAVTAGLVGAGVALLGAAAWRLALGHGRGWAPELAAGVAASLPFGVLTWISQAWWAVVATILVAVVAALLARWQGYERDRPGRQVRPTSSARAG